MANLLLKNQTNNDIQGKKSMLITSNIIDNSNNTNLISAKEKKTSCHKEKAKKNIIAMLISISFLYSLCNLPYMVFHLSRTFGFFSQLPEAFISFAFVCLGLLITTKIFIYFGFNNVYRQAFYKIFKITI